MATVSGFIMSARWIPCPRIYASCRFRHKFGCPGGAALTPRTRRRPTSWTTVDHGFIELIRKGFAALRRPRESESRDASVRGVGGEGAVLPIRSCGTDQPRQPAHTWGHPAGTERRAAVNRRPAGSKWMRSGSPHDRNVRTHGWFEPGVHVHAHVDQRSNSAWFELWIAWELR